MITNTAVDSGTIPSGLVALCWKVETIVAIVEGERTAVEYTEKCLVTTIGLGEVLIKIPTGMAASDPDLWEYVLGQSLAMEPGHKV